MAKNYVGILVKPGQSLIQINNKRIDKVTEFKIEQYAPDISLVTFTIVADQLEVFTNVEDDEE